MNKRILFAVMVVAQLCVPAWMIASQETVLKKGTVYRFKTAPVDPYDAFRGRYVWLSTELRSAPYANKKEMFSGRTIYVVLEQNSEGFAAVKEVKLSPPQGEDYIKTKANYYYNQQVHFNLPLSRFYMNEQKAPQAERLYRENNRRDKRDAYITARVHKGSVVIEDLYVAGQPIMDYFK